MLLKSVRVSGYWRIATGTSIYTFGQIRVDNYYPLCYNIYILTHRGRYMKVQVFDQDQLHYINKGAIHHQTLKNRIDEALFNNPFKSNFVISSLPGLGKSFETQRAIKKLTGFEPVIFEGSSSISAYQIEYATAKYLADMQNQPLFVINDDCDILYEDKNVNIAKKMFDDARVLKYGKNFRGLKGFCTELQFEALEYWNSKNPNSPGFSVPTTNTTFLILTNRHFPTINEVEKTEAGSAKETKLTDLYAIRRRTEYKEIEMTIDELWGYVANIVLNEQICEKFMPTISQDLKHQILTWAHANWPKVTERNLSLVEKMTKDIVRYPTSYKDIWKSEYL